MIYGMVEYINRNGKITVKAFSSKEDLESFVKKLKTEYLITLL